MCSCPGQVLCLLSRTQLSLAFRPPNLPIPIFETARGPLPPVGLSTPGWKVSSTSRPPGFHSAPRGWLGKFPETPTLARSGRRCLVSQAQGISLPLPLAPMLVCRHHHPWEISKLHRAREPAPAGNLHGWRPCGLWCALGALSQPCLPTARAFPVRVRVGHRRPGSLRRVGWEATRKTGPWGAAPSPGCQP